MEIKSFKEGVLFLVYIKVLYRLVVIFFFNFLYNRIISYIFIGYFVLFLVLKESRVIILSLNKELYLEKCLVGSKILVNIWE